MSIPRFLVGAVPLLALSANASAQSVWHVTVSGSFSGSGASWSTPTSLDGALAASSAGDEIRIAEGLYNPTVIAVAGSTDPRDRSFLINKSLTIIGGWLGHEVGNTLPQGCPTNTILSGDLDDPTRDCDNSYHVVSITGAPGAKIVLTRVFITEGNAVVHSTPCSGTTLPGISDPRNLGAGVYIKSRSTVQLSEIIVDQNLCEGVGGGIYANGCTLAVSQSAVLRNAAFNTPDGGGGGIYLACPSARLVNVVFQGNGGNAARGGGMYASGGDLELTNCTFEANSVDQGPAIVGTGGAIYLEKGNFTRLFNCSLGNNAAHVFGAESIAMNAGTVDCFLYNTIVYSSTLTAPHFAVGGGGSFKSSSCYLQIPAGHPAPVDSSALPYPTLYNPAAPPLVTQLISYQPGGLSLAIVSATQVMTGGDPTNVPADTLDLDGDSDSVEVLPADREGGARFTGTTVSMGAYEVLYPSLNYLNLSCSP